MANIKRKVLQTDTHETKFENWRKIWIGVMEQAVLDAAKYRADKHTVESYTGLGAICFLTSGSEWFRWVTETLGRNFEDKLAYYRKKYKMTVTPAQLFAFGRLVVQASRRRALVHRRGNNEHLKNKYTKLVLKQIHSKPKRLGRRLTKGLVDKIRDACSKGMSNRDMVRKFNVSKSSIVRIVGNKTHYDPKYEPITMQDLPRLTNEQVQFIREHPELSAVKLAVRYGVSAKTIWRTRIGISYKKVLDKPSVQV